MCLNASLAGLVAITAPCDVVDAAGSVIIGVVAGLLVVFGVWFCDNVAHVDDPVGAVAVHCLNGIWGTIAVVFLQQRQHRNVHSKVCSTVEGSISLDYSFLVL